MRNNIIILMAIGFFLNIQLIAKETAPKANKPKTVNTQKINLFQSYQAIFTNDSILVLVLVNLMSKQGSKIALQENSSESENKTQSWMTTGSSDFFIGYNIPNILSGLSVFTRYGSSPSPATRRGKRRDILGFSKIII